MNSDNVAEKRYRDNYGQELEADRHYLNLNDDLVVCQNPAAGKVNADKLLKDDALLPTKAAWPPELLEFGPCSPISCNFSS